jgi:hypothetical protein
MLAQEERERVVERGFSVDVFTKNLIKDLG